MKIKTGAVRVSRLPSPVSRAVGILGGTFAPVHNGHVRLAIELRESLELAEVRLIPAAQPPHRAAPAVPAQRRYEWVQCAVAGIPGLVADARELRRPGPSYTVDTLESLRAELPGTPLCLLLGQDAFAALHTWDRAAQIPRLAHVAVVGRPGANAGDTLERYWKARWTPDAGTLHTAAAGLWLRCAAPLLDISASRIRALLRAGRAVDALVPAAVLQSLTTEDLELLTRNEETTPA